METYQNSIRDKNSPEAGTCYNTNYNNFYEGLNYQIKDTFFFSFIIQFLLVSLMYYHVGSGKYWKVLFLASLAGLIAAIIEHSSIAFICQKSQRSHHYKVVTFFIEEFFWIFNEYSIPYLNLIKMETFSQINSNKTVKYLIFALFIPFSLIRLYNGYDRMMMGYLQTEKSTSTHGLAFGVIAVADIICTICIFHSVTFSGVDDPLNNVDLFSFIKKSSYTILIMVDIVSIILSVLYIISTFFPSNTALSSSITLFHCLKSEFLLILTTDALILKYEVNNNSIICLSNSSFASSIDLTRKSRSNCYSIEIRTSVIDNNIKSINDTSSQYNRFSNFSGKDNISQLKRYSYLHSKDNTSQIKSYSTLSIVDSITNLNKNINEKEEETHYSNFNKYSNEKEGATQ